MRPFHKIGLIGIEVVKLCANAIFMRRAFLFEYSEDELIELIKVAVRDILHEQQVTTIAHSPPTSQDTEVLSPTQVCNVLHISRPTLSKYNKLGKIKAVRIGGKIFYKKSDINKLFK